MSVRTRSTRRRWAGRLAGVVAALALGTAALPAPYAVADDDPATATSPPTTAGFAPSTNYGSWVPALAASVDLRAYLSGTLAPYVGTTGPTAQDDVQTLRTYFATLPADRAATIGVPAGGVGADLDRLADAVTNSTPTSRSAGPPAVFDTLVNLLRVDIIGSPPGVPVDLGTIGSKLTAVISDIEARVGGAQQDVIDALPTADELLATVRDAEDTVLRRIPGVDTDAVRNTLDNELAASDRLLVGYGKVVAGLADAGAVLAKSGDAAGLVYDTIDAMLNADSPGLDDLRMPDEQEVASDDVAQVPATPTGKINNAAVRLPVDGQLETVNATVRPVKGQCYMRDKFTQCAPPLTWRGGPVQHNPIVYLVFWGPKWNSLPASLRSDLQAMYGNMNGNGYQDILTQHYDSKGQISGTVRFGGMWIDNTAPTAVTTQAEMSAEAVRAARANGWSITNDAQFQMYLQPGAHIDAGPFGIEPCGYHNYSTRGGSTQANPLFMAFAGITYPGPGCVVGTVSESLRNVGSHEYAEAATDPMLNAWADGFGEENADLCNDLPGGSDGRNPLWSNDGSKGYCTYGGFTPRYTYKIVTAVAPPDDDATNSYTRGHRYDGGEVDAVNTGNVPWFRNTSHPTRLGTVDPGTGAVDKCSASYDPPRGGSSDPSRTNNPWASCIRSKMTFAGYGDVVEPNFLGGDTSRAVFNVRFKPDGTLNGGTSGTEAFRLVADGRAWMSGSTVRMARDIGQFSAQPLDSAQSTVDAPVLIPAGSTATVSFTYKVTGAATWYANEVVALGTAGPDSHASLLYDPATWPRVTTCTKCRGAKAQHTAKPGATETFSVVLRAPSDPAYWGQQITEHFRPVIDVPKNGGGVQAVSFGPTVTAKVVVVPNPLPDHAVVGSSMTVAAAGGGVDTSDATNPVATDYQFACYAVGGADSSTTQVTACSAAVIGADGTTYRTYNALPSAPMSGATATTAFTDAHYNPAAGESLQTCWSVRSTFLDGEVRASAGCAGV